MSSTHWLSALTLISTAKLFNNTWIDHGTRPIIDGDVANSDEIKYAVGINCNHRRCTCTGSIINELYVVSAAHCFIDEKGNFRHYYVRIVAGTNDVANYHDPARVEMSVEKVYVPGGFNYTYKDDIAVLKLRRSLDLKKNNLQELRLPAKARSNTKYIGKNATLLGFGVSKITYTVYRNKTVDESNHPNAHLHSANISIIANDKCDDKEIVDTNLCGQVVKDRWAKHYGGCGGDSGGPLVYKSKVLIGVYIRGPATCNERYDSGVYTKVRSHIDFINNAMKDNTTGMIVNNY